MFRGRSREQHQAAAAASAITRLGHGPRGAILYRPSGKVLRALKDLLGYGLYGCDLNDVVDRLVCDGILRRMAVPLLTSRQEKP